MFVIYDERHAEMHGEFSSFQEAMIELKRRAQIPWDEEPNRAPCMNWEKCGRSYGLIEYDESFSPGKELRRVEVLNVSASGAEWLGTFEDVKSLLQN
jgi:hypothetical protein